MCLRAHTGSSKEGWRTHSSVNAASLEYTLGKEMAARRQWCLDDCRLKRIRHRRRASSVSSWKTWMPFEGSCARQKRETGQSRMPETKQPHLELIFHARHPQETRSGGNGNSRYQPRMCTSCFRLLRKPPEQQPSEPLTCEKCGARVRGERGLKIHLQQRCGQSTRDAQTASRLEAKKEMQGFERVKRPCSYCRNELILHSIKPHCS